MKSAAPARSSRARRLVKTSYAAIAGAGLVALGLVSSVSAQTTNTQPFGQPLGATGFPSSEGSSDPFSSRGNGQGSGVMDLIHRAMQGQSKGAAEFKAEQDESLDSRSGSVSG